MMHPRTDKRILMNFAAGIATGQVTTRFRPRTVSDRKHLLEGLIA
jgi:hypothetical protein